MLKQIFIFIGTFTLLFFAVPPKNITVYLVGDSTMSEKEERAYPETGWGMPFKTFFDESIEIENRARNGRSTRTFISEQLWQRVYNSLKEGDYVFIQFGHNDASIEKFDRYSNPQEYRSNLEKFVNESRAKRALPVLITPVTRRKFDKEGNVVETHAEYSAIVREVASSLQVPLIDLDLKSQALLQKFGEEQSKLLFLHLEVGEHPNYPEGKEDNTHFSELGARKIAQLVLKEIENLKLDLADHIIKNN